MSLTQSWSSPLVSGTNRKAFDKLNRLGITFNVKTTLKTLQASKTQGNDAIRKQRQQITERRSTNQQAKMAVDDEWVDLTEWEKADEATDDQMNLVMMKWTAVSQTEAEVVQSMLVMGVNPYPAWIEECYK
nr:uncharacterized protein LOC129277825 [Lytechinus pictus]